MADTYSTNLKVRLPQTGAYSNTWGAVINSDSFGLLDQAITGQTAINIGTAISYSLAALANGVAADSRSFALRFTGTPASLVTVTMPASVTKKIYLIDNQTGQSMLFTYSASTTTVTVTTGTKRLIWCDGTDCFAVFASASDADTLDGINSTQFARLDIANIFTKRNSSPFITVTESPTTAIDSSLGNNFILTLTGNRTVAAPSNAADGHRMLLLVAQDGTGNRTLTWNSIFLFENGLAPTLATAAAAIDMFIMVYNSALAKWVVEHAANISAGAGASFSLSIDENTTDWNLLARLGSLSGSVTVNVTLSQGVVVQALSTGSYALDFFGLPAGSTVNFTNLGYNLGRGGDGSRGALVATIVIDGSAGRIGGAAIRGPGAGNSFNVTNASGFIWGGGGGGGSGAVTGDPGGGGGGGGGAGGGHFGPGGVGDADGTSGSTGVNGIPGLGGSGSGLANAGAAGGDWGVAGATPASGIAGGAAGKAIELAGGAITWISGSGSPNVKGVVS